MTIKLVPIHKHNETYFYSNLHFCRASSTGQMMTL